MIAAFWRPASSPISWYLKAIRPRTSAIRGRSTRSGIAARRRPDRSRRSRLEQPVGRNKRSALRDCRKEGRKRLMALHKGRRFVERAGALALAAATLVFSLVPAQSADPLTLALTLSLTGATAPAGRRLQAGLDIWRDPVNAAGSPPGRHVPAVPSDHQPPPPTPPPTPPNLLT